MIVYTPFYYINIRKTAPSPWQPFFSTDREGGREGGERRGGERGGREGERERERRGEERRERELVH
ncbi:hypothetical protein DPMN_010797 [Dreissena polymorpha]|uniref:Uncharacterized protein n=1 Tax=Dreissena polymorpha TaxID=45954 RepID=A0A9D4RZE3_DREPO|nr:hypothetical protein DPMN_010797 [Dreissena polymorpha]